jgi:hypothetical protein
MAKNNRHKRPDQPQRPHVNAHLRERLNEIAIHLDATFVAAQRAHDAIIQLRDDPLTRTPRSAQGDLQQTLEHDVH